MSAPILREPLNVERFARRVPRRDRGLNRRERWKVSKIGCLDALSPKLPRYCGLLPVFSSSDLLYLFALFMPELLLSLTVSYDLKEEGVSFNSTYMDRSSSLISSAIYVMLLLWYSIHASLVVLVLSLDLKADHLLDQVSLLRFRFPFMGKYDLPLFFFQESLCLMKFKSKSRAIAFSRHLFKYFTLTFSRIFAPFFLCGYLFKKIT